MSDNRLKLADVLGIDDPAETHEQKTNCTHPEHPDANPSLGVIYNPDTGMTRVTCYSLKCDLSDQLTAAGVKFRRWPDTGAHTVLDKPKASKPLGALEKEYEYVDEFGRVLYIVERFRQPDGGKTFRQRQPDGTRSLKGVSRVLYHLPEVKEAAEAGRDVYVVEGEKDADRLRSLGLTATTCAQGAGKWQQSFSQALKGAHVIVIADKDEPGYKHARQIQSTTQPLAQSVRVVQAKSGKDVSDHLDAGHGLADLEECPLELAPHAHDPYSFFIPKVGLAAQKLLSGVLEFGPVVPDDTGLLWSYADGVYRPDGVQVVKRRVAALLGDHYRREHASTVLDIIQNREPAWTNETLDSRYINTPSGLIDWKTLERRPHNPHVPSTNRVPVEWDPEAECPEIDKWIADIFPAGDCADFVYEIIGYALLNKQPLHKCIMLYGTGRNGKGTLLRLLTGLLGTENISAVVPQDLDDNRFASARLYGKLANLCGDVNAKTFTATQSFKQATGEDYMGAERKGQDGFEFTVRALLIAAFNELPRTNDTTEGYFSRWIVLPFTRRFSEEEADRGLDGRLQAPEEMRGLLVKAVQGLQRLMARGNFDLPPSVLEATQDFRKNTDPVQSFLSDVVVADAEGTVPRSKLYDLHRTWAQDNGVHPFGKKKFFDKVCSSGSALFDEPVTLVKRRGDFVFAGLKLLPKPKEQPEEEPSEARGAENAPGGQKKAVSNFTLANSQGEMKTGPILPPAIEKCPPKEGARTKRPVVSGLIPTIDFRTGKTSTPDASWHHLFRKPE